MESDRKKYKVILVSYICKINKKLFSLAVFKEDLSLNYGEKHFLTESGEISFFDFVNNTVPDIFKEINGYIEKAWETVYQDTESQNLSSYKQDAWRFFADYSPKGKLWFMEAMYSNEICESSNFEDREIVGKEECEALETDLTYTYWSSLVPEEKLKYAKYFVKNPVNCMYAIINSPYHEQMKVKHGFT